MKNQYRKLNFLLILLLISLVNTGSSQVTDDAPIRINTVLLNVPVVVSDKDGRNITGLKKEDFSVFQEGVKQTIEFFANTEEPLNVAIVVDTSSSVRISDQEPKKGSK